MNRLPRKARVSSDEETTEQVDYYDEGDPVHRQQNVGDIVEYYDNDVDDSAENDRSTGIWETMWETRTGRRATASVVLVAGTLWIWKGLGNHFRSEIMQSSQSVQDALEQKLFSLILGKGYARSSSRTGIFGRNQWNDDGGTRLMGEDAAVAMQAESLVTPVGTPAKPDGRGLRARYATYALSAESLSQGMPEEPVSENRYGGAGEDVYGISPMTPQASVNRQRHGLRSMRPRASTLYAFATVCSSNTFVIGAAVLGSSLRRHHPGVPLICIVISPDVSVQHRTILEQMGWDVRTASRFLSDLDWQGFASSRFMSNRELQKQQSSARARSEFQTLPDEQQRRLEWERNTFNKLRVWELTEFEKVIYIDSDAIITAPLSELFQRDELAAAKSGHGLFNSGVMLLRPSTETCSALKSCLLREEWRSMYKKGYPFPYGDQPLLSYFFQDAFEEIPAIYNTTCQRRIRRGETRVVHYNGPIKPWHVDPKARLAARFVWTQNRWKIWTREFQYALDTHREGIERGPEQCYWG